MSELEPVAFCALCGGTGATTYTEEDERTSTIGTRLCACRASLAPRDGRAQWWTLERAYEAVVTIPLEIASVQIVVDAEVPVSTDNYRVVRHGNSYWPTTIDLTFGDEKLTLHTDSARELAQRLIQAADAADLIDLPDTDVCGHWAPCDCQKTVVAADDRRKERMPHV